MIFDPGSEEELAVGAVEGHFIIGEGGGDWGGSFAEFGIVVAEGFVHGVEFLDLVGGEIADVCVGLFHSERFWSWFLDGLFSRVAALLMTLNAVMAVF